MDTPASLELAKPEQLPTRLAETQVLLLESINLNIRLISMLSDALPYPASRKLAELFDQGNALFDRAAKLLQGGLDVS